MVAAALRASTFLSGAPSQCRRGGGVVPRATGKEKHGSQSSSEVVATGVTFQPLQEARKSRAACDQAA